MKVPVKNMILGVAVSRGSQKNILEYVVSVAEKKAKKCFIATPNPEMVVAATKQKELQNLLNRADIALCDGVGLSIAASLMGKEGIERITGVDFMKSLCENVAKKPINIGFLGGRGKVAEDAAHCLVKMYPGLRVVFTADEWSEEGFRRAKELFSNKSVPLSERKNQKNPQIDILFVAFGFPKQERFIVENLEKLPVTVAMGVGGAFDFISGRVSRAPFFIRAVGLEWLYRLIRQPWRWKRQLALVEFVVLALRERLTLHKRDLSL